MPDVCPASALPSSPPKRTAEAAAGCVPSTRTPPLPPGSASLPKATVGEVAGYYYGLGSFQVLMKPRRRSNRSTYREHGKAVRKVLAKPRGAEQLTSTLQPKLCVVQAAATQLKRPRPNGSWILPGYGTRWKLLSKRTATRPLRVFLKTFYP